MTFRLGGGSYSTARLPRPYDERVRSVSYAAMAYWYYRWDWGESIAADGIDFAAPSDELASGWVDQEVDTWVRGCVEDGDPVSPMGPMWAVVRRVAAAEWPLTEQGESLVRSAAVGVKSAAITSGAFTPEKDGSHVYVDSLYGLPVALAEYALHVRDDDLLSRVIALTEHHVGLLQDPESGLLAHYAMVDGTGPGIWWGRGNGWGALGLADLVTTIGVDRSPQLTEGLEQLLSALIQHQARSGEWRNLIADEYSYPETSTTAMVTAALSIARDLIGDTETWERGWEAVAHRIDTSGHVSGVSYRPGVNTDSARYEHTPAVGSYPWGQGAWLRAAAAVS